jgi:hypothetical protein
MKKTYTLVVTARLEVSDARRFRDGVDMLRGATRKILATKILPGKTPSYACMMGLKQPRDTYVRVERLESGEIHAFVGMR